jgi:hypothetical protein
MRTHRFLLVSFLTIIALGVAADSSCRAGQQDDLLGADTNAIRLTSSDTQLVKIFNWARTTSESYVGKDSDPVGPWYEAALPGREAFCIRDVSHQCIGAEALGQGKQNLNMLRKFVENISEAKDFCSYWEINRYNKPAPIDYASDDDFWYNLNANFDLIDACFKLYEWTGNKTYINDEAFDRFYRLTLDQYVERWQLQSDKIMDRPALMNLKPSTTKYRYSRGLPSYDELQSDLTVSGDLLGMIYNGFKTYAKILRLRNQNELSEKYTKRASAYRQLIESRWWDEKSQAYFGFYTSDKKFNAGGIASSEFLLWYNVIEKPERIVKSLRDIRNSQVEVLSYLPMLFYRYGMNQEAYDFLGRIYADQRRAYPEAACAAVEGIARGLMGVEPSATESRVTTCPRLTESTSWVAVENLPIFSGLISVKHSSSSKTIFANKSGQAVAWRAMFQGAFVTISVNGKPLPSTQLSDATGKVHSYVDIAMNPRSQAVAEAAVQ